MANLVRSRSWGTVRPPLGAQIDWGHPLAQGLRFCALYDSSRGILGPDLVTGTAPRTTPAAYGYPASGRHYPGVRFDGATTAGWNYGQLAGTNLTGPISVMAIASSTGTHWLDASNPVLLARDSNTAGRGYTLDVTNNGGNAAWRFYNSGGAGGTLQMPMTPDKLQHVIAVDNASTRSQIFVDGLPSATPSPGSTGAPSSTTANLWVGRRDYATFEGYWWGYISIAAIWDRALTYQEAAWLYADPYAFLQPPAPKFLSWAINTPPAVVRLAPPTRGQAFPITPYPSKVAFSPRTGTAPYWWPINVSNTTSDSGFGLAATRAPNAVQVSKVNWAPRAGTAPYWWPLFISNTPSSTGLDTDAAAFPLPRLISTVQSGLTPPATVAAVTPWVPIIQAAALGQPLQAVEVLWAPPRGVDPYWWPLAVQAAAIAQKVPVGTITRGTDPRAYDRQTVVYLQATAIAQALTSVTVRPSPTVPAAAPFQPWAEIVAGTPTLPDLGARGKVWPGFQVVIVGPPPDLDPITITIYDRGHTLTIDDLGHLVSIYDLGHTLGYDDTGHTATRRGGETLTLREQRHT